MAAKARGRLGALLGRAALLSLAFGSAALLGAGCDAAVTPVGSWNPIVEMPTAGSGPDAGVPEPDAGTVEPTPSNNIYLEAESGELSVASSDDPPPSGFSIVADVSASNGQYLEPPLGNNDGMPGAARARYRFNVATDGDFVIWGRIYSPTATQNRFWFQVDDGSWYRWRISTGEIWYWDDFHDNLNYYSELHFQLAAGPHTLQIANCASGAKLDRLYITADGDEPPGNDTLCRPPHSIEVGGECLDSCGSQAPPGMDTSCVSCEGKPMLMAYDCPICCVVP